MIWSTPILITLLHQLGTASPVHPQLNSAIQVSSTPLKGAAGPVSGSFPGFAFEEASAIAYTVLPDGSPNEFTYTLIKNVLERTGAAPTLRIGGTSGDYALYIADQSEPALPVSTYQQGHVVFNTTIGPNYFPTIKKLAIGTGGKIVPMLPLAFLDANITVEWAKAMQSGLGLENVLSIEIGNEPDAYNGKAEEGQSCQPSLTVEAYATVFRDRAQIVANALDLPARQPMFQAFDTSWADSRSNNNAFSAVAGFKAGIDTFGMINRVGHHYYQAQFANEASPLGLLKSSIMNHSSITNDLDGLLPQIDYCNSADPPPQGASEPVGFYLTEVGNSIGANNSTVPMAFGSALWVVDFSMAGMARGIGGINLQQIFGAAFDSWDPYQASGVPATLIYPQYYGMNMVADIISTQNPKVNELSTGIDQVSAYAIYDNNTISRIALVNLNYWSQSSASQLPPRSKVTLQLPMSVKSATMATLRSPQGALDTTLYYAGSIWSNTNGKEQKGVDPQSAPHSVSLGSNNTLTVMLNYTSAALLRFECQ